MAQRILLSYCVICVILVITICLMNQYLAGRHFKIKGQLYPIKRNSMNLMFEMFQGDFLGKPQEPYHYSEFQLLNDNMTYVYAGYYDNRDNEAEVKVIAMIPGKIPYNFTCTVHYPDQTEVEVKGYVRYHYARAISFVVRHKYRNGYVICPVLKKRGRPKSVSLTKQGRIFQQINVTVWAPPKEKNKLTRCIQPFINNYSDVSQLISNIELFRIFGVDKHIIYIDSQTQRVVDVARSYSRDGIHVVEIRNFSIPQPVNHLDTFRKGQRYWAQLSAYHDCILSCMYSSKYVMVVDTDEVIVPRKHKTIWQLADDLFARSEHDGKQAGALMFRNVYFPTFKNKTRKYFPQKDTAEKYNIHPLLYTTRLKTNDPRIAPKSLVRPETVDVMFIHCVEIFKKGYHNKVVEEDLAIMHHYRGTVSPYMYPPESEDEYILHYSSMLSSSVKDRFEKAFHDKI